MKKTTTTMKNKSKKQSNPRCRRGRTEHEWETVQSCGFWGQVAQCVRCGKMATFIIKESDE